MKSKDKIRVLLGLLVIFIFQFFIPNVTGVLKDVTISTVAEKDTYVNSYEPLSNYGGVDDARAGFYFTGDILEAYFYFNFTDKPADFTKVEISLDFWGVSETMNFAVRLINDAWSELSMDWLNKPVKGDLITNLLVASSGIYKIDITNLISNLTNISICVYVEFENYVNDYVYIASREGYSSRSPENAPQLIWTHPEDVTITVTNPTSSTSWFDIDTFTIRWTTSTDTITNVKIELYKGSTFIEEITSYLGYTANDGEHDFYEYFSDDYKGTNYRIKISDNDDPLVYDFSDYFSINVGTIRVTNPTSNSKWTAGKTYTIQWSSTEGVSSVNIELYKGNTLRYAAGSVPAFLGGMKWEIPNDVALGDGWRVKIIDADLTSVFGWSEYFSIEYNYVPIIIGIILGSIALVAISLIIYFSRKKRSPKIIQTIPQQIPQQILQQPPSKIVKGIKYCIKCGNPNKEDGMFCEECGTKLPY